MRELHVSQHGQDSLSSNYVYPRGLLVQSSYQVINASQYEAILAPNVPQSGFTVDKTKFDSIIRVNHHAPQDHASTIWESPDSNVDKLSNMIRSNLVIQQSELFQNGNVEDQVVESLYVQWIDTLITLRGGRVMECDLLNDMKIANVNLYCSFMKKYGGLVPLMIQYPHDFKVVNEAPFLCSIVSLKAMKAKTSHGRKNDIAGKSKLAKSSFQKNIVDRVVDTAEKVLCEAPNKTLKAVEIANALRGKLGVDYLHKVKATYGGLLALLQKYPNKFYVKRISKNDVVSLAAADCEKYLLETSRSFELCDEETSVDDQSSELHSAALAQLTTKKCVPGQPWDCEPNRDFPTVKAIVGILEDHEKKTKAGGMDVSKLRDVIRIRLKSSKTIKSLRLKALVNAYTTVFRLKGNTVSLSSSVFLKQLETCEPHIGEKTLSDLILK